MLESSLEQTRGFRIEEVGLASNFVNRPRGAVVAGAQQIHRRRFVRQDSRRPNHVVEHEAPADRVATRLGGASVVHFANLQRRNVPILGQSGWHAWNLAPPVGRSGLHQHILGSHDQIGFADRPLGRVVPDSQWRHRGRIASRRAIIGPLRDLGDLLVAQRRIVLELLNADVLLDVPGRHDASARSHAGALLDGLGPRPHFFVGPERHRRHAVRAVTVLTAALEDRRDVSCEGDLSRRLAGRRCGRLRGQRERNSCEDGHQKGRRRDHVPAASSWLHRSCLLDRTVVSVKSARLHLLRPTIRPPECTGSFRLISRTASSGFSAAATKATCVIIR